MLRSFKGLLGLATALAIPMAASPVEAATPVVVAGDGVLCDLTRTCLLYTSDAADE